MLLALLVLIKELGLFFLSRIYYYNGLLGVIILFFDVMSDIENLGPLWRFTILSKQLYRFVSLDSYCNGGFTKTGLTGSTGWIGATGTTGCGLIIYLGGRTGMTTGGGGGGGLKYW